MKDPYFAAMMMQIEGLIHDVDLETRTAGSWSPKDSAVKSALRKAELAIGGKKPATKPKGELEEWVAALSAKLVELGRDIAREGGPPIGHIIMALKATQDSLDTQREMAGHARGYLDFLEGFMSQARGGESQ